MTIDRCGMLPQVYCVILGLTLVVPAAALPAEEPDRPASSASAAAPDQKAQPTADFVPLFPDEGVPEGWLVREWNDLAKPVEDARWVVKEGVLHGSERRGTWLVSQAEYSDFELHFEFKLGEEGNSGCALRAPLYGDPAFDGLELQMVDLRYRPESAPSELTGGIYRAIAPKVQVYKPVEWNRYEIVLEGRRMRVRLNDEWILDLDLFEQYREVKRHDGTLAPPVKDRPLRGHIGFQELSRGGTQVQIRNARLKVLDPKRGDSTAEKSATEDARNADKKPSDDETSE